MSYTYSIIFKLNGFLRKEGCGTEEQMFASALEYDKLGAELLSAEREVWEEKNGYHHLVRIESDQMGKPTCIVWEADQ